MQRAYIQVYYMTTWDDLPIARIPGVYKNRERVNRILDSLNRKYLGTCYFTSRDVCEAGKPMQSLREMNRLRRQRHKHGLTA